MLFTALVVMLAALSFPPPAAGEIKKAERTPRAAKKISKEAKKAPKAAKKLSKTTEANVAAFSAPEQTGAALVQERQTLFQAHTSAGPTDYSDAAEREVDEGMDVLDAERAHAAREQELLDRLRASLTEETDLNARDAKGNTRLHLAVQNNFPAVSSLLLERGADINIRDEAGRTALGLAEELGLQGLAAQLSAAGGLR